MKGRRHQSTPKTGARHHPPGSLHTAESTQLADLIQYRVRIEEGDRAHEVQFDDASGDPPLLELVERVTQLARSAPG